VHEGSALLTGEDGLIDGCGEFLAGEDEAGAGSAKGFVGGGCDDVRVRHGRRVHASGYESCEVSHVDDEERAGRVGDLAHAGEVEKARVGAAATDDDFGLFADCCLLEEVVVDGLGIFFDAIRNDVIELAGVCGRE
jgi:hypothetical protein